MAVTGIDGLNKALADLVVKTEEELVIVQSAVCLQILSGVVYLTPVDTGRLRANWQLTIGEPAAGVLEVTDPTGATTVARESVKVTHLTPFQVAWISNNVEYCAYIENGTEKIPARLMLATTVERVRSQFTAP
jgi:hypothetical protein